MGVHRPPHLIFTLFQSNIYKVNVREFVPRDKTDKECPEKCAHICISLTMSKKILYIFTRTVRKALYTISDKNKT